MISINSYYRSILKIIFFILVFFIFSNLMPVIKVFGVPYTLQTICIMGIPFFVNWKELVVWYVLLLVLTALGVPLMSNFSGGIAVLQGLTAGFIYGWFLQMLLIKKYTDFNSSFVLLVMVLFLTTVLDVACGAIWNIVIHDKSVELLVTYFIKLLPFGLVKVIITAILLKLFKRLKAMSLF